MKRQDIYLRDPFILPDNGRYYMYGTKGTTSWSMATEFPVYVSENLEDWEELPPAFTRPDGFWADRHFWAPEVHRYKGAYYMLASFYAEGARRGTQILRSDRPEGPFLLHSDGPVTPLDWDCLDGTLYLEDNGRPWMVFCHEWTQIQDGTICAMPLSDDLSAAAGEPVCLFHGSEALWAKPFEGNVVTDGPYILTLESGTLLMLWSTAGYEGYCIGCARSEQGITGPWIQDQQPIFAADGGHGMVFHTFDGRSILSIHYPNVTGSERPHWVDVQVTSDDIIPLEKKGRLP